jgi:hypothetical protein
MERRRWRWGDDDDDAGDGDDEDDEERDGWMRWDGMNGWNGRCYMAE